MGASRGRAVVGDGGGCFGVGWGKQAARSEEERKAKKKQQRRAMMRGRKRRISDNGESEAEREGDSETSSTVVQYTNVE